MPDTLEVRIAHLEGAYEQIDKRLGAVEAALSQLRQEMAQLRQETVANFSQLRQEMAQLRQQTQEQFRWILGFQILTWISILGTLLAILFRR